MGEYRSIFLEPDWALVRFYGWQDRSQHPAFRVLTKRYGPFHRHFVMNEIDDATRVCTLLREVRNDAKTGAEVVFHDFASSPAVETALPTIGFSPMPAGSRILNTATYVIDLGLSDDEIRARMSSDCRRKIHQAEKAGHNVLAEVEPTDSKLSDFHSQFHAMAAERNIRRPSAETVKRMFHEGQAILFTAQEDGRAPHYLMTYRAGDKAIFLYGVGRAKSNSGVGHLLHWQAMRSLRDAGVRWYDMGGVTGDETNGIHRFKKGFGGEFVNLGQEYVARAPLMQLMRAGVSAARRLGRRVR